MNSFNLVHVSWGNPHWIRLRKIHLKQNLRCYINANDQLVIAGRRPHVISRSRCSAQYFHRSAAVLQLYVVLAGGSIS